MHGQGHKSLFTFYPQLDFTEKTAKLLVEKLAEKFYGLVDKHKGMVHGESDSPTSTDLNLVKTNIAPSEQILELYKKIENTFDPDDIFNPGKKTSPRFDIKGMLRNTN